MDIFLNTAEYCLFSIFFSFLKGEFYVQIVSHITFEKRAIEI